MKPGVAVAVSGGRDSIALLHVTQRLAQGLGVPVHALHVHHGLVAQADAWRDHVLDTCARWGVPCRVHALRGRPGRGDSVEAWARRERYAALATMARETGVSLVLLAHHRRDQAETLLLQALRGAGPAGLAAMPRQFERDGMAWARPWLGLPREAIEAYVRRHRLRHVDDASNDDPRFSRNRLRLHVWPALQGAFADAETALVAAAERAHEADAALHELAELDLAAHGDALRIDVWSALSPARRANALREWLRRRLGRGAPQALVERLLAEVPAGRAPARWPLPEGAELRRYRGELRLESPRSAAPPTPLQPLPLRIARAGVYRVPGWHGALRAIRVREGGVALAALAEAELRPRLGAEQFQASERRPPRALKKQFQAASIAPWRREAPLLWVGGRLAFVPGLGVDARARAAPGEPQLAFEWLPD